MYFFDLPLYNDDLQMMLDKHNIKALVEAERYFRDNLLFDQMEQCYSEESRVRITWYDGDGREFVRRSSKQGLGAKHKTHSTMIWLNGYKAIAEMQCTMIGPREILDGIQVENQGYVRLLYKVQKENDDVWRIKGFDCIYERDWLNVISGNSVDMEIPKEDRESYKILTEHLRRLGLPVSGDLPGEDRLASIKSLYDEANDWLFEQ